MQDSVLILPFFPKLGKCRFLKLQISSFSFIFSSGTGFVIRRGKEHSMKILFTALALASCISAIGQKQHSDIKIISTLDGIFHFKVAPKLREATIEVFDSSNRLISKQGMNCKRMMIDFYDAIPGTYYIQISKGDFTKQFQYTIAEKRHYMKIITSEVKENDLSFERFSPSCLNGKLALSH